VFRACPPSRFWPKSLTLSFSQRPEAGQEVIEQFSSRLDDGALSVSFFSHKRDQREGIGCEIPSSVACQA
jgi:hypothetical protein